MATRPPPCPLPGSTTIRPASPPETRAWDNADRLLHAFEARVTCGAGGELQLTQDVTIDGDWDNNCSRVTLSGGWSGGWEDLDGSRILRIDEASIDVVLRDLTSPMASLTRPAAELFS